MWLTKHPDCEATIQTDACPKGYGGIYGKQNFRGRFPKCVQSTNIAILEMWAVMIGVKFWAESLRGKYFWIQVDNEAVASVLNSGAAKDIELQNALREIAFMAAKFQFVIKARHIPGVLNRIPDWLSQWGDTQSKKQFRKFAQDSSLKRIKVNNTRLQYDHDW